MNPKLSTKWIRIVVGISLLLFALVTLPIFSSTAYRAPEVIQASHLKSLANALVTYAGGHDGRFPGTIADLPPESVSAVVRQFQDPATAQLLDWIYYSGVTLDDPPGTVLAASPSTVYKDQRIVARIDGSVTNMSDVEFQRISAHRRH